jgi:hypothetical protein
LSSRFKDRVFILRFQNGNNIRERSLRTITTSRIVIQHDLNLDTEDTLTQINVTNSSSDIVTSGVTRVNEETVRELHGLGTSSTDLTGNNDFTTLSTGFHNETNDTITGTTNSQTIEELELDRLTLSNSTKTTVLDTFGVEFDSVLGELETLLNKSG